MPQLVRAKEVFCGRKCHKSDISAWKYLCFQKSPKFWFWSKRLFRVERGEGASLTLSTWRISPKFIFNVKHWMNTRAKLVWRSGLNPSRTAYTKGKRTSGRVPCLRACPSKVAINSHKTYKGTSEDVLGVLSIWRPKHSDKALKFNGRAERHEKRKERQINYLSPILFFTPVVLSKVMMNKPRESAKKVGIWNMQDAMWVQKRRMKFNSGTLWYLKPT